MRVATCLIKQRIKRVVFAVVLIVALGQCSYAWAEQTFNVMSINAQWLWTPHDEMVDGSALSVREQTPSAYARELRFYADLVAKNKVDLLALIEIENLQVAKALSARLAGRWDIAFVQGIDTATGQDVALLVRDSTFFRVSALGFPSAKVKGLRKPKKVTKLVVGQFNVGGGKKTVSASVAHLLSKRAGSPIKTLKRQAQALAWARALNRYGLSEVRFVMGDFNDGQYSKVLTTLTEKLGMKQASISCKERTSRKNPVDHILYAGAHCMAFRYLKLDGFSDHPAVFASFRF